MAEIKPEAQIEMLRRIARKAEDDEHDAKHKHNKAKADRVTAFKAHNNMKLASLGFEEGMIVEVPHYSPWSARLGDTEVVAITGVSGYELGKATGRVATKANLLHKTQRHTRVFDIEKAVDTGRRLIK